jgi:hypothetical protein
MVKVSCINVEKDCFSYIKQKYYAWCIDKKRGMHKPKEGDT